MKKRMTISAALTLTLLLAGGASFAEHGMQWRGSGGWGPHSKYERMYHPKTVETVRGAVERVDLITPMEGMSEGVHLAVKTDTGPISVHLGPAWFIENQDIMIQPGDEVEITGSRTTFNGKPAIIAKEVRKGNQILVLRDDNGYPAWSGRGQGGGMMGGGGGTMH